MNDINCGLECFCAIYSDSADDPERTYVPKESIVYLMHCSILDKELADTGAPALLVDPEDQLSSADDEFGVGEEHRKKKWVKKSSLLKILFSGHPGLKIPLSDSKAPITYFNLIFDEDFYSLVALYSNQAGKAENKDWEDVTKDELKIFIGLLFHFGDSFDDVTLQTLEQKSSQTVAAHSQKKMLSARFMVIMRSLTFGPSTDRMSPLTPLIDFFNQKMDQIYYPKKNLVIDHPIINFKWDTPHKDHRRRSKGEEYGLKLYYLSQPEGIVLKYLAFLDFKNVKRENLPEFVTLNLLDSYLEQGHSVFTQKSFTSVSLARKLLRRKTHLTGPLNFKRTDNSLKRRVKVGETLTSFSEGVSVQLTNFLHITAMLSTEFEGSREGTFKSKLAFDQNMTGDRRLLLSVFRPMRHIVMAWWRRFAIHIIHTMLTNSWMLFQEYSGRSIPFEAFRGIIMQTLISENADNNPLSRTKNKNKSRRNKGKKKTTVCPQVPGDSPGLSPPPATP